LEKFNEGGNLSVHDLNRSDFTHITQLENGFERRNLLLLKPLIEDISFYASQALYLFPGDEIGRRENLGFPDIFGS